MKASLAGRRKAVAIHTVVLIAIFGMLMLLLFMILSGYIDIQNCEVSRMACGNRRYAHCFSWWKNDQNFVSGEPEWKPTKDCDEANAIVDCAKPSANDCNQIVNA